MCGGSEHIFNIPKLRHGESWTDVTARHLKKKFGCVNETGRFIDHVTTGDEIKMKNKKEKHCRASQRVRRPMMMLGDWGRQKIHNADQGTGLHHQCRDAATSTNLTASDTQERKMI
jgi:hypothetical protein